jgi:hypothetical protein
MTVEFDAHAFGLLDGDASATLSFLAWVKENWTGAEFDLMPDPLNIVMHPGKAPEAGATISQASEAAPGKAVSWTITMSGAAMYNGFIFATGIENSIPTIENGRVRMDEMEKCGHYRYWRTDFDLVEQLGIRALRYGAPLHLAWPGPGKYDWSFADETFRDLRRRNIVAMADLCHFGVPDWIGNFQNPDFPTEFAKYARALPLGPGLYAGQRDADLRPVFRHVRLVERAAGLRLCVCHRDQEHRQGEHPGHARDP